MWGLIRRLWEELKASPTARPAYLNGDVYVLFVQVCVYFLVCLYVCTYSSTWYVCVLLSSVSMIWCHYNLVESIFSFCRFDSPLSSPRLPPFLHTQVAAARAIFRGVRGSLSTPPPLPPRALDVTTDREQPQVLARRPRGGAEDAAAVPRHGLRLQLEQDAAGSGHGQVSHAQPHRGVLPVLGKKKNRARA